MNIYARLDEFLSEERKAHTLATNALAQKIGRAHNVSSEVLEKIEIAALLHDIGKDFPLEQLERIGVKHYDFSELIPGIIHARISAYIAEYMFNVHDKNILSAIKYHPTGHPDFDLIGKILFISDYAEEKRAFSQATAHIRILALQDIDRACFLVAREKIQYLLLQSKTIDPMSIAFYNRIREVIMQ